MLRVKNRSRFTITASHEESSFWKQRLRYGLSALAVLGMAAASACSGVDSTRLPGMDSGSSGLYTVRTDSCSGDEQRQCGITLEQDNGVLSCFRGVQNCQDDKWGPCQDGQVTREVDMTSEETREALSYSSPVLCSGISESNCAALPDYDGMALGYSAGDVIKHGGHVWECLDTAACNSAPATSEPGVGANYQTAWDFRTTCGQLNPCDPACMIFNEDPPDITTPEDTVVLPPTVSDPDPLPDWGDPGNDVTCAHALCDVNTVALDRTCHPCVDTVCSLYPSCCDGAAADSWDATCVEAVFEECTNAAPPVVPYICEFSALADDTTHLGNSTSYPGSIGAKNGITMDSGVTAEHLITEADITISNASSFKTIYTTGNVTTESGLEVENIIAGGDVYIGNAVFGTGVQGVRAGGSFDGQSGFTIEGDVVADFAVNVPNASWIKGDVHAGTDITYGNGSKHTPGQTFYAGRDIALTTGTAFDITAHALRDLYLIGSDARIGRNAYAGQNMYFQGSNTRVGGLLHVGTDVHCTEGSGSLGEAYFGGILQDNSGGCSFNGGAGNPSSLTPPLIDPTPPNIPPFPSAAITVPSVDQYARDTADVCALAASLGTTNSSAVIYPGVHGAFSIPNGGTMTLAAPGNYVLYDYTSSSGADFQMSGGGPWDITVCQGFALPNSNKMVDTDTGAAPEAKLVTIYSGQSGGTCISTQGSTIVGVLIAPDCDVDIGNATIADIAVWAENITTDSGVNITLDPEDCAAVDRTVDLTCGGLDYYRDGIAYNAGDEVTTDGLRYVCRAGMATECSAGGWTEYWPGRGVNWANAWEEFDDCPEIIVPGDTDIGAECPIEIAPAEELSASTACESALNCQSNSSCSEVLTDASCSHSKCASGPALSDPTCRANDACVDMICAAEPSCCSASGRWDQTLCADKVETLCGADCGAVTPSVCSHNACVVGAGLSASCSPEVATVCGMIPSCCNTGNSSAWNDACIDQLTLAATGAVRSSRPPVRQSLCDYAVVGGNATVNLSGADVTGNVASFGNSSSEISGSGSLVGDALAEGDIPHTDVSGSSLSYYGTAPYSAPVWPSPSGCVGLPSGDEWRTSDLTVDGSGEAFHGDLKINSNMTMEGGTYYVRSLDVRHDMVLTLPTDGSAVDIYVCSGSFQSQDRGKIISPVGDELQLRVFVNGHNITLRSDGEFWGVFANAATGDTASLGSGSTLYGMLHNVHGAVSLNGSATIDASGIDPIDCIDRGNDPAGPGANECPTGNSPEQAASAVESGTCSSNLDAADDLIMPSAANCADVDLTLGVDCEDEIPVCNRGQSTLTAGDAEIVFYPRTSKQFATLTPDDFWEEGTKCTVDVDIAPGECQNVVCPTFSEDMTARVQTIGGQTECNTLDNWGYYAYDLSCGSIIPGETVTTVEPITEVQKYHAECPDDSKPAWGFLAWDADLQGDATISFDVRTSTSDSFSGAATNIANASRASGTESCSFLGCSVDVSGALWPGGYPGPEQPQWLEASMTLTPDGMNTATLADWRITYTCLVDQ